MNLFGRCAYIGNNVLKKKKISTDIFNAADYHSYLYRTNYFIEKKENAFADKNNSSTEGSICQSHLSRRTVFF